MKPTIAITAMSGIFPGPAGPVGPEEYWRNIQCAVPAKLQSLAQKWGLRREDYFDPKPGVPYRTYLDAAHVIADTAAAQIELGRQVVRDLFHSIRGTPLPAADRVGLLVGTLWCDASYFAEDARRVVGTDLQIAAGFREGALFGPEGQLAALAEAGQIQGPALAIDTACASSLNALDTAIGLVARRRADAAVVMGLNGFLPPFMYFGFSKLTALSPKAQILPFSADASGIIPSETIGAVLVEPLDQALQAGRRVLAIIRGLGLSADGGDRSVFAPSPHGQQLAYERAYRTVDPRSIDYVEAHGTATVLGDATEIETLDRFFAPHRAAAPLPIGSVKALIGHSIGSAGIASLIKGVCMLRDGTIPPHISVRPNPKLLGSCLRLPSQAEAWPHTSNVRRVGVSSFGFGGANAHLILGSLEDADLRETCPASSRVAVAILAVDATLADSHGLAAVAQRFEQAPAPQTPFPWQRFRRDWTRPASPHVAQPERTGAFFPAELSVESHGLRMGPKALARLDPLQRLAIHAVQQALHEGAAPYCTDDMAVVFCSNLGGETGLQLSRHYLAHFSGQTGGNDRYAQLEPTLEGIASSLASLASGFVAFHFGMKGFHQTVSGDARTFWQTLDLTSYWLDGRSESLVLAAGRHIKSPLDLECAAGPAGEGVAAFLLASEDTARRKGRQPVAVIRAVVPCGGAGEDALVRACEELRIPAAAIGAREISQLQEGAEPGSAQKVSGFLAEATGAESLLRVLLTAGTGWRVIEIREGSRVVAWVFLEKLRELYPQQQTPAAPLPVQFQAELQQIAEPVASGALAEMFLGWQRNTEAAMISYLRAQARLTALAGAPQASVSTERGGQLRLLRADERNIVLDAPLLETGDVGLTGASARLKVDETHPYFFDHALDHVPGILILEGVLQLVELLMPESSFLQSLDLNFRKFCEKTEPILIRAQRRRDREGSCYAVDVLQHGEKVARCELEAAPAPAAAPGSRRHTAPLRARTPDPKFVHKQHPANVLVTELEELVPGQMCACYLLPPQPGHILHEGSEQSYSMLYLLETTRQFVMLVAHTLEKIPLGMPMNLASIRVRLDRPVPRDQQLHFLCFRQPVHHIGRTTIAEIAMELHGPDGRLGETAIKAQVVDNETYSRQRGFKTQSGGRK